MVRENMKKTAETSAPILSEIAERWSPRAYDTNYEISSEDLTSILEAGRWAPSANNKGLSPLLSNNCQRSTLWR